VLKHLLSSEAYLNEDLSRILALVLDDFQLKRLPLETTQLVV
jgi:hypothetical protein